MAGQIPLIFANLPQPCLHQGKSSPPSCGFSQRSLKAPDVPTLAEVARASTNLHGVITASSSFRWARSKDIVDKVTLPCASKVLEGPRDPAIIMWLADRRRYAQARQEIKAIRHVYAKQKLTMDLFRSRTQPRPFRRAGLQHGTQW